MKRRSLFALLGALVVAPWKLWSKPGPVLRRGLDLTDEQCGRLLAHCAARKDALWADLSRLTTDAEIRAGLTDSARIDELFNREASRVVAAARRRHMRQSAFWDDSAV